MKCKNCKTNLKETANFCDECGGKVIKYRLNFKMAFSEFFTTFISWDNTFFKTFIHLLIKPQEVTNGYLEGVRKRYMQPFAYMVISLTIYSIYMYFSKNQMLAYLDEVMSSMPNVNNGNPKFDSFMEGFMEKWITFITKYFNIFTFSTIPFLALINRIIFKKLNFIEHNIALFYAYATYILGYTFIGFTGLIIGVHFKNIYPITTTFMLGYHMFFYMKVFSLSKLEIVLKTLLFWIGMLVLYLLLGIFIFILTFILLKLKVISF